MILKIFKSNQASVLLVLPLIAAGLWLPGILHPGHPEFEGVSPLFMLIDSNLPVLASQILALLVLLFTAMLVNNIVNQNSMFGRNTFLPALFYVLLMSSMKEYQIMSPIIFSNLFIVLALRRLFMIYRQVPCKREVFDASLLILIGSLFYFPAILMFPVVWVALSVLRPFVWREWALPFFALIMVVLYVVVALSWQDELSHWKKYLNLFEGQYQNIELNITWISYLAFALMVIVVNLSGYHLSLMSRNSSIRFRKLSTFFLFVISLYVIELVIEKLVLKNEVYILLGAVPLSILFAFFFQNAKKKWLETGLFYAILGIVIVNIFFV